MNKERDRRVSVGIAAAMVARVIGMAAPLVITPLCFGYLGAQRYGLWMAVTALTGMAWFADLGLGNGLLTRLSQLAGDTRQQAREIASGYATICGAAVVMLGGLAVAVPAVSWDRVFGVADPVVAGEATTVVVICFAAFVVNIPASLIQRIQFARGQAVQSSVWQAAGPLASMAAVIGAIAAGCGPLTVIAGAVLAIPVINLLNAVVYFGWQATEVRPTPRLVHRATAVGLLRLGVQFFALTAMSAVAINVDSPLAAHILGSSAAAHYAVAGKLFGALSIFIGIVAMVIWPVNGEALARGEAAWVRRNARRIVLLNGIVVGAIGTVLVVYGDRLLTLWVSDIDPSELPPALLAGLAGWSFLLAVTSPLAMVQTSVGQLRWQFVGWASFLLLATALKVWALHHLGLAGLPFAACVAYVLTMCPATLIGYRRALRRVPPASGIRPASAADPAPERGRRVLRVVGELNYGGTEARLAELLPRLAVGGVEVHLITLSDRIGPGPLADVVVQLGGSVTPLPLDSRFPVRFLRLLRRLRPDAVHVDCANFSGVPLSLARLGGVSVRVAHFRGDDDQHRSLRRRASRWLFRRLLRANATDILGVSPSSLTVAYDHRWREDPRCQMVLNGLDLDRLRRQRGPDLRAAIGAGPGDLICLTVGRASPEKRRWLVPPIVAALRERGVHAHAVLVGPGEDADDARVRESAAAAGLTGRIHLLGPRDDVGWLLQQADVVVHPSCLEGLPGGVLEPVALGIGTVAADLPGARFISEHLPGVTIVGVDAPPRVWAAAVLQAAGHTATHTQDDAAHRFANSVFAIDAAVATHLTIYRRSAARRPHHQRHEEGSRPLAGWQR